MRTGVEEKEEEEGPRPGCGSGDLQWYRVHTPRLDRHSPVKEHMVQINWLAVEKKGRKEGRKEGVSE